MNNPINIEKKYQQSFARIFSPLVMDSIITTGKSGYLSEVLMTSGISKAIDINSTVKDFFDWLYSSLLKSYRNEYIYKNAIANKILLGKHSLNTSHMLSEFRTANCKADVVILNGTSTVYEIKSEYDSIDRLSNQISSYSEIFDNINVITSYSQLSKITEVLPVRVGLMVLTPRYTIKTIRDPESGKACVNPDTIFNSLRKTEYIAIIKRVFAYVPDVPNTQIYKECKKLFCTMSPEMAHDEMLNELSRRGNKKVLKDFVSSVPSALKAYALSSRVSDNDAKRFIELLENRAASILVPVT